MGFDFGSVKAETTALPKGTRNRGSNLGPNPFGDMLSKSWNERTALQIVIPASAVADAERLIRAAADTLNLGVRVVITHPTADKPTPADKTAWKKSGDATSVKVGFQAKEKRAYKGRAKKATAKTPAPAPAAATAPAAAAPAPAPAAAKAPAKKTAAPAK